MHGSKRWTLRLGGSPNTQKAVFLCAISSPIVDWNSVYNPIIPPGGSSTVGSRITNLQLPTIDSLAKDLAEQQRQVVAVSQYIQTRLKILKPKKPTARKFPKFWSYIRVHHWMALSDLLAGNKTLELWRDVASAGYVAEVSVIENAPATAALKECRKHRVQVLKKELGSDGASMGALVNSAGGIVLA